MELFYLPGLTTPPVVAMKVGKRTAISNIELTSAFKGIRHEYTRIKVDSTQRVVLVQHK
jgi:hypothetical protein